MRAGERTLALKCSENADNNPVLKDLEHSDLVEFFYLKTYEHEIPIRIEFLRISDQDRVFEEIAGLIYSLSAMNRFYPIPAVLIEADQRVRLSNTDMEFLKSQIKASLGPFSSIREMRRRRRPF
jgi:hypothetical protein